MNFAAFICVILVEFAFLAFIVIGTINWLRNEVRQAKLEANRRELKPERILADYLGERP